MAAWEVKLDRRSFLHRSLVAGASVAVGSSLTSTVLSGVADAATDRVTLTSCGWGAHAAPRGTESTQRDAILSLESEIGRPVGIMRRYTYWDSHVPDATHGWAAKTGRTPYISWHAYTRGRVVIPWAAIAAGEQDGVLTNVAASLKALAYPIYFGFHHEPENDPKNGSPAEFTAAWHRVRGIFDEVGATNLIWVPALMASTFAGGHGGHEVWLPPVDDYDLVGVDGYNRWPMKQDTRWKSFAEIFTPCRQVAVAKGKGLFVGEFGTLEQTANGYPGDPGAKARWIQSAGDTIRSWPEVQGLCYSHAVGSFNRMSMQYWVDTSDASLAAFAAVGADPYFAPGPPAFDGSAIA